MPHQPGISPLTPANTSSYLLRARRDSAHTVWNYLILIFDKLGISSRVELVLVCGDVWAC
jgi:DNA-binding CsgD family transcriptional regulator